MKRQGAHVRIERQPHPDRRRERRHSPLCSARTICVSLCRQQRSIEQHSCEAPQVPGGPCGNGNRGLGAGSRAERGRDRTVSWLRYILNVVMPARPVRFVCGSQKGTSQHQAGGASAGVPWAGARGPEERLGCRCTGKRAYGGRTHRNGPSEGVGRQIERDEVGKRRGETRRNRPCRKRGEARAYELRVSRLGRCCGDPRALAPPRVQTPPRVQLLQVAVALPVRHKKAAARAPFRLVAPRSSVVTVVTGAEAQPIVPPRAVEKTIDVGLPETQVTPVLRREAAHKAHKLGSQGPADSPQRVYGRRAGADDAKRRQGAAGAVIAPRTAPLGKPGLAANVDSAAWQPSGRRRAQASAAHHVQTLVPATARQVAGPAPFAVREAPNAACGKRRRRRTRAPSSAVGAQYRNQ